MVLISWAILFLRRRSKPPGPPDTTSLLLGMSDKGELPKMSGDPREVSAVENSIAMMGNAPPFCFRDFIFYPRIAAAGKLSDGLSMLLKGLFLSLVERYVPSLHVTDRGTDSLNHRIRSPVQDSALHARVFASSQEFICPLHKFEFEI